MDICENEGVIMKIKDYYKLSSTAAVVLQTYSETWGAFHLRKKPGNFGGSKSGISDW